MFVVGGAAERTHSRHDQYNPIKTSVKRVPDIVSARTVAGSQTTSAARLPLTSFAPFAREKSSPPDQVREGMRLATLSITYQINFSLLVSFTF
jgi:hypothetical protein